MIKGVEKNKLLILFDGVCNLCNNSILFICKRDKKNKFLFAPLGGVSGASIISMFNIDIKTTDSLLVYDPKSKQLYVKSTAILLIAKHLGFPYNFGFLLFLIPPFMRNWAYDFFAKNRYKWFGKKDECIVPTRELRAKFLE